MKINQCFRFSFRVGTDTSSTCGHTVQPQLSRLVGTWVDSPDNQVRVRIKKKKQGY